MRLRRNDYVVIPYPHEGRGGPGGPCSCGREHRGGSREGGHRECRGGHEGQDHHGSRGGPRGGGPGMPGGPRRGGRARRGDVRLALLSLLAEESGSGYALIKRIEEKTGGVWRTSPGSVYPTLSQLVDEGFVVALPTGGGRNDFEVTDAGREFVEENTEKIASIWAGDSDDFEGAKALRHAAHTLLGKVRELGVEGTPEQIAEATKRLNALATEIGKI